VLNQAHPKGAGPDLPDPPAARRREQEPHVGPGQTLPKSPTTTRILLELPLRTPAPTQVKAKLGQEARSKAPPNAQNKAAPLPPPLMTLRTDPVTTLVTNVAEAQVEVGEEAVEVIRITEAGIGVKLLMKNDLCLTK